MSNVIYVKDGDDLSVIVRLDLCASDPVLCYPAVAQTFRVTANSFGPTLVLTPLKTEPTLLTEID